MKRKDSILQNHIDNVYPIKTPGEGWKDHRYYWTKLTPQCRGHEHKIYAKTQEELETKIVAYYLNILDDRKLTLENLDANLEKQKTPKKPYLSAFWVILIERETGLKIRPWMNPIFGVVVPACILAVYIIGMVTFEWR